MTRWSSLFKRQTADPAPLAAETGTPYWVGRSSQEPEDPIAHQHAAAELARRGDREGAVVHWLAAGDLFVAQRLPLKGISAFGVALRADPSSQEARSRIVAFARREGGRPDGAPARIPFFSELPSEDLIDLACRLETRKFVAGEILLRQGEVAGAVSVLVDGVVRILGKNGGRRAIRVGVLSPGDVFGMGSVLAGLASAATLAAEIPGELLVLPMVALEALLGEKPHLRAILDGLQRAAAGQTLEAAVARLHKTD